MKEGVSSSAVQGSSPDESNDIQVSGSSTGRSTAATTHSSESPDRDPDRIIQIIREQIQTTPWSNDDHERLASLVAVWGSVAEASKAEIERQKLRIEIEQLKRSPTTDRLRFWTPIVAPLLGALAVAATLVFQIYSFNLTLGRQQQLEEAGQFREALNGSQFSPDIAASANAIMIKSFLKSPTQGPPARELSLFLLSRGRMTIFNELFPAVFGRLDQDSLPSLRAVCALMLPEYERQIKDPREAVQFVGKAAIIGKAFEQILRNSSGRNLDLTNAILWDADLSRLDLSGFTIRDAVTNGAVFNNVTAFDKSIWNGTAWWRAKTVSPALLDYLKRQFPYDEKTSYSGDRPTPEEYAKELERLQS